MNSESSDSGSVNALRWDFWALLYPAPDLVGQWIAHCLNLDVVTQGDSPTHARSMLVEAVGLMIEHELDAGRDPLKRRAAPEEDWNLLHQVLRAGKAGSFNELVKQDSSLSPRYIATVLHFTVVFDQRPSLREPEIPPAWMIATVDGSEAGSRL